MACVVVNTHWDSTIWTAELPENKAVLFMRYFEVNKSIGDTAGVIPGREKKEVMWSSDADNKFKVMKWDSNEIIC